MVGDHTGIRRVVFFEFYGKTSLRVAVRVGRREGMIFAEGDVGMIFAEGDVEGREYPSDRTEFSPSTFWSKLVKETDGGCRDDLKKKMRSILKRYGRVVPKF